MPKCPQCGVFREVAGTCDSCTRSVLSQSAEKKKAELAALRESARAEEPFLGPGLFVWTILFLSSIAVAYSQRAVLWLALLSGLMFSAWTMVIISSIYLLVVVHRAAISLETSPDFLKEKLPFTYRLNLAALVASIVTSLLWSLHSAGEYLANSVQQSSLPGVP